ncbi:MAG: hypothetical protein ACXAEX_17880 [Promethearchaeota archaeon]|jgi:hypothetical protein
MSKLEKCPLCGLVEENEECDFMVVESEEETKDMKCCCQVIAKNIEKSQN